MTLGLYGGALRGDVVLITSLWNVGEVLGVLDRYHARGLLSDEDYGLARAQFMYGAPGARKAQGAEAGAGKGKDPRGLVGACRE